MATANNPIRNDLVEIEAEAEEEELEGNCFLSPTDLSKPMSQYDPNRMKLTKQEHERALIIKAMVEAMPDIDDLPDLWYAQLAIICKDNVDDAIKRCYGMQEFREEYKILDSFQQGSRALQKLFELFPRQMLSFSFSEKDGTYVFVHDYPKFQPKAFTCATMEEDWLRSMYYSHILFFPDLEAIRKGTICVVECEGMNMRRDVLKYFQTFFTQFLCHYPFNGWCRHYHTGTMVNVCASILRQLLPKELRNTYTVGLQFDGHMGDVFLTPTVEQANKRMLAKMEAALLLRYQNEKSFSLEG